MAARLEWVPMLAELGGLLSVALLALISILLFVRRWNRQDRGMTGANDDVLRPMSDDEKDH
jgi:hypothetical protein